MTSNIGIDVSQFQADDVGMGDWLFVTIKLTEGTWVSNTHFGAQWTRAAGKRRGAYHYARPHKSDGETQAHYFVQQVLAAAPDFKPGFDMWQLDIEGFANDGVTGIEWAGFINAFMPIALEGLGALGFLYVGRYFFAQQLAELTAKYNWWLPDYGPNDGTLHALPAGVNPVIHQFTSVNPSLDRNVVHDAAKWQALTAPVVHVPQPKGPTKVFIAHHPGDPTQVLVRDEGVESIATPADVLSLTAAGVPTVVTSQAFQDSLKARVK